MRVGFLTLFLLSTAAAASCYQQPEVPRDKPLRCDPARADEEEELECPVGFRCIASGVCALIDCDDDNACAEGLVCTERTGCDLPGGGDGGPDGGAQGGLLPGGADALNGPGAFDSPRILDTSGGGS